MEEKIVRNLNSRLNKTIQKGTLIKNIKYKDTYFIFIGEKHEGAKNDISQYFTNFEVLLECHYKTHRFSPQKLIDHYTQKVVLDKLRMDESYIDKHLSYVLNEYGKIPKNTKCIDVRKLRDYPKNSVRYLTKNNKELIDKTLKEMLKLEKKVVLLKDGKIRDVLMGQIKDNIRVLKSGNSSKLLQTISEVLLDYEILRNMQTTTSKIVIGIFGKNHVNNIARYLL